MNFKAGIVSGILALVCVFMNSWGENGVAKATGPDEKSIQAELIWSESDGLRQEIFTSSFRAGTWSEPVKITDDNAGNMHPTIDVGVDGRKWVAWTAIEETGYEIRYNIYEQGEWQEHKKLPSDLASNIKPSIIIDVDNIPWIVWSGNNGGLDDIYFSRFIDGEWTEEQSVNPENTVPDILPFLDLDEENNPVVTWDSYKNGDYIPLQSLWNGSEWSYPVELTLENGSKEGTEDLSQLITLPEFITDTSQVFLRTFEDSKKESGDTLKDN